MRQQWRSQLFGMRGGGGGGPILRCSNDPKSMWKCLNILLPKRSVNCPDYIRYNDNDIKGAINIANIFNNHLVDLNKPSDNANDFTYVERSRFTESNCNEEFVSVMWTMILFYVNNRGWMKQNQLV